jgi:hypothetical protein
MIDNDNWASPAVYQGARNPEGLVVNIEPGRSALDLSTVTAVRLLVWIPGLETPRLWATTTVSQRIDRLVVRHAFSADGVDTAIAGRYRILPELLFGVNGVGGIRRGTMFYLAVRA